MSQADNFNSLSAKFELEVREVAADLLLNGLGEPDDCYRRARPLVVQRWKARADHRREMAGALKLIEGGKGRTN